MSIIDTFNNLVKDIRANNENFDKAHNIDVNTDLPKPSSNASQNYKETYKAAQQLNKQGVGGIFGLPSFNDLLAIIIGIILIILGLIFVSGSNKIIEKAVK